MSSTTQWISLSQAEEDLLVEVYKEHFSPSSVLKTAKDLMSVLKSCAHSSKLGPLCLVCQQFLLSKRLHDEFLLKGKVNNESFLDPK